MQINPQTKEAYQLLHDGILALADAEEAGIAVDIPYCKKMQKEIEEEKIQLEKDFWKSELGSGWKSWAKKKQETPTLGGDQLASVLHSLNIGGGKKTKGGKISTDEEALKEIDLDGIDLLLDIRKRGKASGTYLNQLINESVDGLVHPMFNLNIPITYRGSCSNPSIQNFPIRDPWMGKVIRSAIVPRSPRNRIVEADFSGLEVRVAACYNKDPVLLKYLANKDLDMHRDTAMEIFLLEEPEVSKWIRHAAKNKFVFPQFYGSYYEECAKSLWKATPNVFLEGEEDYSVRDHLSDQRLGSLASFTKHIKTVEDSFWNDRFKVYTKWKKKQWAFYLKHGYLDSFTGFRYSGEMKRTEAINYPIQGAAFHCNLWSFIRVNNCLKKYRMKSKLIGQIHDSIIGDVPDKEFEDFYEIIERTTCEDLAKAWKWINVEMEIELEAAPVGASWYEKKEVVL